MLNPNTFTAGIATKRQHKKGVRVEDSGGRGGHCEMDSKSKVKVLSLPRNTLAYGRVVRAHELLHAEYSRIRDAERKCGDALTAFLLNCAEDCMIQGARFVSKFRHLKRDYLATSMYDVREIASVPIQRIPAGDMQTNVYVRMLGMLARSMTVQTTLDRRGWTAGISMERALDRHKREIMKACEQMAPVWRAGKTGEEFYSRLEDAIWYGIFADGYSIRNDKQERENMIRKLRRLLPRAKDGKRKAEPDKEGEPQQGMPELDAQASADNPMAILRVPLVKRCRKSRAGRRARNSGTHINASRLHKIKRGCITGLFREKVRDVGGCVLIDASGSMDVCTETLEKLCAILPASTIAYYCKNGRATPKGFNGHMVIHAQNGLQARNVPSDYVNGGNGVDFSALTWLLSQNVKGRKYFITDEHFCGGAMNQAEKAHELLDKVRGSVTVLESFKDAFALFGTERNKRE